MSWAAVGFVMSLVLGVRVVGIGAHPRRTAGEWMLHPQDSAGEQKVSRVDRGILRVRVDSTRKLPRGSGGQGGESRGDAIDGDGCRSLFRPVQMTVDGAGLDGHVDVTAGGGEGRGEGLAGD